MGLVLVHTKVDAFCCGYYSLERNDEKMHGDKRKVKYYRVRASVFWIAVVGVVTLSVAFITGYRQEQCYKKEKVQNQEWIDITYDNLVTKLADTTQCYLCGSGNRSLMGYYRKFDTIGLISLNDWYIVPFQLKDYDEYGQEIQGDGSNEICSGNTGGISYSSQGTVSRGMADIEVTLPENYALDTKFLQKNLCQECLDKVAASLEYSKWEGEKKSARPLCLVDFDTMEIYSVQDDCRAYFVRDYWVEIDGEGSEVGVEVYYLPKR
ncbi:MAG: hypothetical protein RSE05_09820 [Clostridium sp.]